MKSAVVTWFQSINPLGRDNEEFSRRMFAGESGVRDLSSLGCSLDFPIHGAGLLAPGIFPPVEDGNIRLERERLLSELTTACLASEGAAWLPVDTILFGTNDGVPRFEDIRGFNRDASRLAFDDLRPELGLEFVLSLLKEAGQPELSPERKIVFTNVCITGIVGLGYAMQRIRSGLSRRILLFCNEVRVRPEDLVKFDALGALSRASCPPHQISRPFSRSRSGFVKGEGAGMLIIEEREFAERRGAAIHASIAGFGQSCDAWRLTDGREDAKGAIAAMHRALDDAKLPVDRIDYINAHGTSTPKNDALETLAIKNVFSRKAYDIPVSSLKSQIGHLNYACGIVETIACLLMLRQQRVAPTINFEGNDPECDLYYVPNQSESRRLNFIMKNNYGFGGANASLILKREGA